MTRPSRFRCRVRLDLRAIGSRRIVVRCIRRDGHDQLHTVRGIRWATAAERAPQVAPGPGWFDLPTDPYTARSEVAA